MDRQRGARERGISSLLVANRWELSLVDCTCFEIMRQSGIRHAFTFDQHFFEQGFQVMPVS
jgi:predicted nucleic acid-binding protein